VERINPQQNFTKIKHPRMDYKDVAKFVAILTPKDSGKIDLTIIGVQMVILPIDTMKLYNIPKTIVEQISPQRFTQLRLLMVCT
jgi:hypothetical protein